MRLSYLPAGGGALKARPWLFLVGGSKALARRHPPATPHAGAAARDVRLPQFKVWRQQEALVSAVGGVAGGGAYF